MPESTIGCRELRGKIHFQRLETSFMTLKLSGVVHQLRVISNGSRGAEVDSEAYRGGTLLSSMRSCCHRMFSRNGPVVVGSIISRSLHPTPVPLSWNNST
jgi:hypothetical protein